MLSRRKKPCLRKLNLMKKYTFPNCLNRRPMSNHLGIFSVAYYLDALLMRQGLVLNHQVIGRMTTGRISMKMITKPS